MLVEPVPSVVHREAPYSGGKITMLAAFISHLEHRRHCGSPEAPNHTSRPWRPVHCLAAPQLLHSIFTLARILPSRPRCRCALWTLPAHRTRGTIREHTSAELERPALTSPNSWAIGSFHQHGSIWNVRRRSSRFAGASGRSSPFLLAQLGRSPRRRRKPALIRITCC